MIRGEVVYVENKTQVGKDSYKKPIYKTDEQEVLDVLVVPGDTGSVLESNRLNGVEVLYKLHFPKTFNGSLMGKRVKVRGEWFDVIGDPKPYTAENTPTRWHMEVKAGVVHG